MTPSLKLYRSAYLSYPREPSSAVGMTRQVIRRGFAQATSTNPTNQTNQTNPFRGVSCRSRNRSMPRHRARLLPFPAVVVFSSLAILSAPAAPNPPIAKTVPSRHPARRDAGRQLLLDAREVEPRGHQVPRGGERLHGGADEAHRGAAGDALQGAARPHQGDRPAVPVPQGRLLVLHAHGAGEGLPDLLPEEGPLDAPEEILLDQNELAARQEVPRARRHGRQPRRHALLYLEDLTAFREYTLYVKDLATGKIVDSIPTCGTARRGPTTTRRSST